MWHAAFGTHSPAALLDVATAYARYCRHAPPAFADAVPAAMLKAGASGDEVPFVRLLALAQGHKGDAGLGDAPDARICAEELQHLLQRVAPLRAGAHGWSCGSALLVDCEHLKQAALQLVACRRGGGAQEGDASALLRQACELLVRAQALVTDPATAQQIQQVMRQVQVLV